MGRHHLQFLQSRAAKCMCNTAHSLAEQIVHAIQGAVDTLFLLLWSQSLAMICIHVFNIICCFLGAISRCPFYSFKLLFFPLYSCQQTCTIMWYGSQNFEIFTFFYTTQEIRPFIPLSSPQLSPALYELILNDYLKKDCKVGYNIVGGPSWT